MNQDQILLRAARLLERASQRRPAKPELPIEPWDLLEVYFADPCRPRLTPTAYLVWAYLLRRAEAESRIATVSYRELRMKTGILSTRSLCHAIKELARLGYCVPSTVPTGPGMPRNYKIPEHIGTKRFAHPEVLRLSREADQPRKRRKKPAWLLDAAPDPARVENPVGTNQNGESREVEARAEPVPLPAVSPAASTPTPPEPQMLPDLQLPKLDLKDLEAMNLDEKIEKLGQELDELLKALPKKGI